jgi:hypothetical protein
MEAALAYSFHSPILPVRITVRGESPSHYLILDAILCYEQNTESTLNNACDIG